MLEVTYRERVFIDRFRCIDYKKELKALSYWRSGDLYYFRLNEFNYKTLSKEEIINIEEVKR